MDKHITSEAELIEASINGSNAAFESIVRKYQSLVCAITYSATRNIEKSEELAQETFVRAWKNLPQLRELSKFKSWLCGIANNIVKDHFKGQKRDMLYKAGALDGAEGVACDIADPADNLVSKEEQTVVEKAIGNIPELYRQPLVLFYRQEQSTKQVADQLDISEDNVRARLSRGRKMLKEQVAVMVEKSLSNSGPGKAFTVCVMATVAGIAIEGTAAAAVIAEAGANGVSASAGAGSSMATVMSSAAAKIVTAVAAVAIGIGLVVTYTQNNSPGPEAESTQAAITVEGQGGGLVKPAVETLMKDGGDETIADVRAAVTGGYGSRDTDGLAGEDVQTAGKGWATAENNGDEKQADGKLIVGGIITSESGEPVAGADVKLFWDVIRDMPMLDGSEAVSDPNGSWQCEITGESEDISVRIKHPEYLSLQSDYRPSFYDLVGKTAVFVMNKGLSAAGYVFDRQGKPIGNALIMPPRSITSINAEYGIQDSAKTARTDQEGVFLLKSLKSGTQDIVIDAVGYAPTFVSVDVSPSMEPIEVIVDRGETLNGVVVDINNNPLSGVKVKIDSWDIMIKNGPNVSGKHFEILRRQVVTDAQGRYLIEHLPSEGEVTVAFIKRPGLLFSYLQNDMAKSKIKNVTIYPIPTITGTVVDADSGKPITEFEVDADCTWDPNSSPIIRHYNTKKVISADGTFSKTKRNFVAGELPSLGWVAVRISTKGYFPTQSEWIRIDQEFSPITIALKKAKTTLGSTLAYSSGKPASNAEVIITEHLSKVYIKNGKLLAGYSDCKYKIIKTDAKGYFEFTEPAKPGKILVLGNEEYAVADTNDLPEMLTTAPWAYVMGVLEASGKNNSNVKIQIAGEESSNGQIDWMSTQSTNVDGSFKFFYIPAITQKTYYGPPDSTGRLNKGPEIKPDPGENIELLLGGN